jgi:hypothetical protein
MSAALDFQGDQAMTKAQSKLFVLQPVRRSGRARPPLLPALKKSTTRLREAATRDKVLRFGDFSDLQGAVL